MLHQDEKAAEEAAPAVEVKDTPPERPWTPSYTVTRQGTSPLASPKVLAAVAPVDVEDVPPISDAPASFIEEPAAVEEPPVVRIFYFRLLNFRYLMF